MSMKMLSKISISLTSDVGMSMPHWNIYCSRPTVLRHTDLPPAFGPEISRMCFSRFSERVSGTISFFSRRSEASSRGWRARRRLNSPLSERMGIPAIISRATSAFERMKSISPIYSEAAISIGNEGRRNSVNSSRMRAISRCSSNWSSRIWLPSSTISKGSTKAVLPVADSP